MSRRTAWINLFSLLLEFYLVSVRAEEQCPGLSFSVNPGADVKFSLITTIRRTTDGKGCGAKISSAAIQNIAAIQWVVDRMNENNYTEGIELGFDVHDDCGLPRNAMARALDILDGPSLGSPECEASSTMACNIGIIGASESDTTEAILYALRGSQVPVIGPYASYHNLSRYADYYRTTPTDIQQIQATAKLLQQLGLTYVAVVHTDDDFGRFSAQTLKIISRENGICVGNIQMITTGPDINKELLKQQREKTKHNSLRVVYFGRRDIYKKMQIELGYSKSEVFNISWIVVQHPEDDSPPFTSTGLENGTYIISNKVNDVHDINTFLADKWNKSTQASDDLERLISCSGENTVPNLSHKEVASTIDAVFVYANALQRQANFYCNAESMFCAQLRRDFKFHLNEVQRHPVIYRDINENVTVEDFAQKNRRSGFNDKGELLPTEETVLYEVAVVSNQDNLTKVGEFRNNTFVLENYSKEHLPSSICNIDCAGCEVYRDISFAFLDGETFLLGIFAVHEADPNDPFKCSKFRTSQMDIIIIETFLYSVQKMRNETGIQFGAIAIDDCYSAAQTELVLSQILSGEATLINPLTGNKIEVDRIAAVVMTVSSSVTIPVGFLMTELKVPVISASASSPDLDDRINFPYFLRTVPSDIEQARAMIGIIKEMGWKYVSLLYVENNYGNKGKEAFERLANESGICIADSPEGISDVKDDISDSELIRVFTRLVNQRADVVVYFGTESRIADFLQVANGANEFIFLASEDWGDRQYILDFGKRGTLGSVTLKNEVESLADDPLAEHLRSLSPNSISNERNPWFVEYWEENFLCDLPQSFRHKYDKICDDTMKFSDETVTDFVEDHRIVHTVTAVQALSRGLKRSQEAFCNPDIPGVTNTFPCPKYFQYISDVVAYIKAVEISRGGKNVRVFKDDGNGNVGFKVNNVQEVDGDGSLGYKTVGSYEEGQLTLQKTSMKFYRENLDGACSGAFCGHCSNVSYTTAVTLATTTRSYTDADDFTIPDYTIIAVLGFLVILILVLCIIIACYFKRRIIELEAQLKETKYEIRTGYTLHNCSSFTNANTASVAYPDLKFANLSPSGGTMYEWSKAQNVLNGGNSDYRQSNGGVVNQAFEGEMYLHATHDENELQQSASSANMHSSPRGHQPNSDNVQSFSDSPVYRPPSNSYGISSHSSFKRPSTDRNHNDQIKKQPRTQLAVPPCRPELPPRDSGQGRSNANKPNGLNDQFDHMSPSVPKEKVRKVRSSPRRTISPPSFKNNPSMDDSPRHRDSSIPDSSKFNGSPTNMTFSQTKMPSPGMVNLAGSVEKISRV